MTKNSQELIPIPQAAKERGVTRQAMHELVKRGRLSVVRIGRKMYVTRAALDEFMQSRYKRTKG